MWQRSRLICWHNVRIVVDSGLEIRSSVFWANCSFFACSYGGQVEFFFIKKSKILWHCTFKIIHGPLYMVHILTYIFLLYSKFYSKMFTVNAIFFPKTCWIINFRIHRNSFLAKRFKGAVSHENVWNDFKHQLFKWYCPSGLTLLFAISTWQQIEKF